MPETPDQIDREPSRGRGTVWVAIQGVLFVVFFGVFLLSDPIADFSGLVAVRIVGVLVAVAGSGLSVWAVRLHGPELSPYPAPVPGTQVITTGVYGIVRHPMYGGIVLFSLGTGLAYAKPWVLLTAALFLVFFAAKSKHEEQLLVDFFEDYAPYQATVRWRIIPFIA